MANRPCSCIQGEFSLLPTYFDVRKIILHDLSKWVEDDGFTYPDFFMFSVIFPNEYKLDVEANPKNGIVVEGDFVDGIYKFSANICGEVYEQHHLIYPKILCCLNKARITLPEKKQHTLDEIYKDLDVAKENAIMGNFKVTTDILKLVNRKISALSCNCNC